VNFCAQFRFTISIQRYVSVSSIKFISVKLFCAKFRCFQSSEFARLLRLVFNSAIATNGFGYELLRVLALNLASTHQTENPRGFSEVGENKQLLIAIVVQRYFFFF